MPEGRVDLWRIPLTLTAVVGATAIQLVRQSGQRSWDTIWAEDASVYTTDVEFLPALETLFRSYAGYAQLLPRLLALGTRLVQPDYVAKYLAVAATGCAALLALFVYRSALGWVASPWLRFTLALGTALAPVLHWENTASLANLTWVLLFAAFWAVFSLQDRWFDVVSRAAVVFFAITSSPLGALFVPAALWVAYKRRARPEFIVAGAILVGGALQGLAMLAAPKEFPETSTRLGDVPLVYGVRVVASALFGERPLPRLWARLDAGLAWGALAVVIVVLVLAFVANRRPESRRMAMIAAVHSVGFFVMTVGIRGTAGMRPLTDSYNASGARYAVVPILLLVSAVVVLVDGTPTPARVVLVGHAVLVTAVSLVLPNLRSNGPSWAGQVESAEQRCAAENPDRVRLEVSPGGGWAATLRCDRFEG